VRSRRAPVPRIGVVLAAGRSERLHGVTGGGSKALVRLGGLALIERTVLGLLRAGIEQVVVVVGYNAGSVAAVAKGIAPGRVRTIEAKVWEAGNGASLAAAERAVTPRDHLFVLVTADHVFGEGALDALLGSEEPAVLIDGSPSRGVWEEGTRVRIRRGAAIAFSKQLTTSAVDCGAFLVPREVFAAQRRAAAAGDHSLAGAITRLAEDHPLRAVYLPDGAWWQDVDTPDDLAVAKQHLRRSLVKETDGPVSRHLNRPISTTVSLRLAATRVSPDLVSVVSFALALVGAWLLASGSAVAGALAVHAASVLDGVDGELARLLLRAGPRGAFLDGILDRLGDAAVIGALGVWGLREGASPSVIVALTVAATAGAMLSMATKDRIAALGLPQAPERALGWLFGGRDGRLFLVVILSGLGRPAVALAAVAVTSAASLAARATTVLRRAKVSDLLKR
jgi:choline kinase/phosphatidylglycerophosphate synthase